MEKIAFSLSLLIFKMGRTGDNYGTSSSLSPLRKEKLTGLYKKVLCKSILYKWLGLCKWQVAL